MGRVDERIQFHIYTILREGSIVMIRILYSWRVKSGAEETFVRAWTRGTCIIRETIQGANGSLLLRDQNDPSIFIAMAHWDNLEDYRAFRHNPFPDPESYRIVKSLSTFVSATICNEVQDLYPSITKIDPCADPQAWENAFLTAADGADDVR
jgi:heme-degrading monooxygenase HmoA